MKSPQQMHGARYQADLPIADKLDRILRVLAALATKDMKQRDQIALLQRAGLRPREIADLLGTSANTVRVELVALRRRNSAGKRRVRAQNPREG